MEAAAIYGVVYRIECLVNGKRYHGQTINPKERWQHHCRPDSHCYALRSAVKKYGADNFVFLILEAASSKEELDDLEKKWVSTSISPKGYNLKHGGANGRPSAETRRRLSEASKRSQNRPEVREKNSEGVRRAFAAPEMRARLSASGKARLACPGERERLSAMMKEIHADPDQKKLRSTALKASWASYTPEEREARVQGLRNSFTPERRLRVSTITRETMAKPEVKAKHKAALQKAMKAPEVVAAKRDRMKASWAAYSPKEREARIQGLRNSFTPERRLRISTLTREAMAKPEVKAKHKAALKKALNAPEVVAAKRARMKASWAAYTPKEREARLQGLRNSFTRPGEKERRAASISAALNTSKGKAKLAARRLSGESLEAWKRRLTMCSQTPMTITR